MKNFQIGDTTHNDIWNKINDFLEGVKYVSYKSFPQW